MKHERDRRSSAGSPSLASIVASGFSRAGPVLRARLLQQLLLPIGPLAMAVVAGGAFAKYVPFARRFVVPVSAEEAMSITGAQLAELARYLEQSEPAVLEQLLAVMSRDPAILPALGLSLAAVVASLIAKRRRAARTRERKPGA